jgi:hypothetical protein
MFVLGDAELEDPALRQDSLLHCSNRGGHKKSLPTSDPVLTTRRGLRRHCSTWDGRHRGPWGDPGWSGACPRWGMLDSHGREGSSCCSRVRGCMGLTGPPRTTQLVTHPIRTRRCSPHGHWPREGAADWTSVASVGRSANARVTRCLLAASAAQCSSGVWRRQGISCHLASLARAGARGREDWRAVARQMRFMRPRPDGDGRATTA